MPIDTIGELKLVGLKSGFKLSIPRNVAFRLCQCSILIGSLTFLRKIVNSKTIAAKHSISDGISPKSPILIAFSGPLA
jgi:hypothetical protein